MIRGLRVISYVVIVGMLLVRCGSFKGQLVTQTAIAATATLEAMPTVTSTLTSISTLMLTPAETWKPTPTPTPTKTLTVSPTESSTPSPTTQPATPEASPTDDGEIWCNTDPTSSKRSGLPTIHYLVTIHILRPLDEFKQWVKTYFTQWTKQIVYFKGHNGDHPRTKVVEDGFCVVIVADKNDFKDWGYSQEQIDEFKLRSTDPYTEEGWSNPKYWQQGDGEFGYGTRTNLNKDTLQWEYQLPMTEEVSDIIYSYLK